MKPHLNASTGAQFCAVSLRISLQFTPSLFLPFSWPTRPPLNFIFYSHTRSLSLTLGPCPPPNFDVVQRELEAKTAELSAANEAAHSVSVAVAAATNAAPGDDVSAAGTCRHPSHTI